MEGFIFVLPKDRNKDYTISITHHLKGNTPIRTNKDWIETSLSYKNKNTFTLFASKSKTISFQTIYTNEKQLVKIVL